MLLAEKCGCKNGFWGLQLAFSTCGPDSVMLFQGAESHRSHRFHPDWGVCLHGSHPEGKDCLQFFESLNPKLLEGKTNMVVVC